MACGGCKNLLKIATQQKRPVEWLKAGLKGVYRCAMKMKLYSDVDIAHNRATCLGCEYRSDKDTNPDLTFESRCLGPDAQQGGAPCGCILLCKVQVGKCPIDAWKTTQLTINREVTM